MRSWAIDRQLEQFDRDPPAEHDRRQRNRRPPPPRIRQQRDRNQQYPEKIWSAAKPGNDDCLPGQPEVRRALRRERMDRRDVAHIVRPAEQSRHHEQQQGDDDQRQ